MTPEELAEIEERARKATAGPWTCIYRGHDELDGQKYDHDETPLLVMSPDCESHPVADASCNHTCRMPEDTEANAAFIAHARADVPALVAEVRRLREENETLKANALPPGFVALHRGAIDGELDRLRAEVARLREALDAAQRIVKRKADREAGREET